MSEEFVSLSDQRVHLRMRLQMNRRLILEEFSQSKSFPHSKTLKIISQPDVQLWLAQMSQKFLGVNIPWLVSTGLWLAEHLKKLRSENSAH